MIDIASVIWKEWRELVAQRGFQGKAGIIVFLLIFGLLLPLQTGPSWITSPLVAVAWSWVPMFLVSTVIADSFAGERERHTLETLLATRLSDASILLGKMGAALIYAGAMTATCLTLGLVALNLANPRGGLLLYQPQALLVMVTAGVLGALLVAATGVLISLRSATVRQAQQTLSGAIILFLILPAGGVRVMPAGWRQYAGAIAIVAMCGVLIADAALVALVLRRFRRARLVAG